MFYLYECEIHIFVYELVHIFNNSIYIFVHFNFLTIVWIIQLIIYCYIISHQNER
jgi:hypothetical protein